MSPIGDMKARGNDDVWKALADPTRRKILETLANQPTTTGEIVERFSDHLVRTAVMKHLDILEQAGLIQVVRSGRRRWNHLRHEPLKPLANWLQLRTHKHQQNLHRLKQLAESTEKTDPHE